MKIDIYRSRKNSTKYLSVPAGTDVSAMKFPANLDPDLRELCPFKSSDVSPGDKRIAANGDEVIAQIKRQGFATHGAAVKIDIQ